MAISYASQRNTQKTRINLLSPTTVCAEQLVLPVIARNLVSHDERFFIPGLSQAFEPAAILALLEMHMENATVSFVSGAILINSAETEHISLGQGRIKKIIQPFTLSITPSIVARLETALEILDLEAHLRAHHSSTQD